MPGTGADHRLQSNADHNGHMLSCCRTVGAETSVLVAAAECCEIGHTVRSVASVVAVAVECYHMPQVESLKAATSAF